MKREAGLQEGGGRRLPASLHLPTIGWRILLQWMVLAISVLGIPPSAAGQLTEGDTLRLGYRLGLNGSWITGNVNRMLVISSADLSSMHSKWAFRSGNTYQLGTFGKVQTEGDLFSKNFIYLLPKGKVYAYAMCWVETNVRRQYPLRLQAGPGMTATLVHQGGHLLKLSLAGTWETTRFQGDQFSDARYDGSDRIDVFRGTCRVFGQNRLASGRVRLRYELWGQAALNHLPNYRIHGDFSADFPLSKRLSFRFGFNYNYDAVVVSGVRQQDTFTTFGLNWSKL